MASDYAEGISRRSPPGIWRVDYLEASLCGKPRAASLAHNRQFGFMIPSARPRDNREILSEPGSYNLNFVFAAAGGAALLELVWGHW